MTKKFYSLVFGLFVAFGVFAQPATPATDPTAAVADVISVYSNAYTDVAGTDFFPNWGQSTVVADFPINGNATKQLTNFNYQGVQFASPINASTMHNLHIDLWAATAKSFELFLINAGGTEQKVTLYLGNSGWNSFDIPLSNYPAINLSSIIQFKFVSPVAGTTVYYDNLYFWKTTNPPTLGAFTIAPQLTGAAPFAITDPSSTSGGAFTYTSSNPTVATISGNMVTVVGVGNSTITATQAAAGGYGTGVAITTLNVAVGPPTTAAADPTELAADVISVYSDYYTNLAGTDFFPNWSQSTVVADFPIGTNNTKRLTNFNYQGIQFATPINASTMQNLHIDLWSADATSVNLFLINPGPIEQSVPLTLTSGWNSFDIPLTSYPAINLSNIIQFKLVSTPFGGTTVYYDNLYFWRAPNLPNLTNFSVPSQIVGAAPFAITPPTSNSAGAFTYTSSNTNVATIIGNTITIVGIGNTTITATQAANGPYGQGIITTILTVTPPAAPATILPNTQVYSLFNDTYTPTNGVPIAINWNPNWSQSTIVSDVMIAGNNTRKYDNLNYQGVEFTPALNVSSYDRLHIDIWTPNCTSFRLFLINTGPPLVEQFVTLTPTFNGWNSYEIDMALFRNIQVVDLTTINQMKFDAAPFGTSIVYMDNLYFYNNISLPITLTNFKATPNKNVVNLKWATLSETNNKGFYIEKSTDGVNFTSIGFVNGKVNSSTTTNYGFTDNLPVIGNNFYRLKQVDLNGAFAYSPIELVKITKQNMLGLSFYPNPVINKLNVNVGLLENNTAQLNIINSFGQIMLTQNVQKNNSNKIVSFDVSAFSAGVYFIQLKDGSNSIVEKLVLNKN